MSEEKKIRELITDGCVIALESLKVEFVKNTLKEVECAIDNLLAARGRLQLMKEEDEYATLERVK